MSDFPQPPSQNHVQPAYAPQGYPPGYAPQGYPPGYAPQGQQFGYAPQQPAFTRRDRLPGTVIAASIIWIIYGGLGTIGGVMTLVAGGRLQPSNIISLGLAVFFLMSGIQALTGKLRGVLAPGITSIVIGALTGLAFLVLGALARGFHLPAWLFGIGVVIGLLLITAGILAAVGNRGFKEWRATKGL